MYTVILSSRQAADFSVNPLIGLLDSFEAHTTEEEKKKSEWLIKFDSDDPNIPTDEKLNSYNFNIQKFVWDKHAGRASIHEVNNILYKFADKDCKFVQFMADDFVFTRGNFVTEILEHSDTYKIAGYPGMGDPQHSGIHHPPGGRGYCPAFSSKILDCWAGTTGPHSNTDGVATGLADILRLYYNYEVFFAPGDGTNYYVRTDCVTSRSFQMTENQSYFNHMTHPPGDSSFKGGGGDPFDGMTNKHFKNLADGVMKALLIDKIGGIEGPFLSILLKGLQASASSGIIKGR